MEPAHQLESVVQRMVLGARLQHYLVAEALAACIYARSGRKGAGTHQYAGRGRNRLARRRLDIWRTNIFVRPCSAYARADVGVVPKSAAAVHIAGKEARYVGAGRYGPRHQLAALVCREGGYDVQRVSRAYFVVVEVGQLTYGQTVPVGDLRDIFFHFGLRHRALHYPSGRIDMVHNIQGRRLFHLRQELHQPEKVLAVVEVTRADILYLHDHGIELPEQFHIYVNVVGVWGKLCVARREDGLEIAPPGENVIHIASPFRIPAVLGTEAADLAFLEALVELLFESCGPE